MKTRRFYFILAFSLSLLFLWSWDIENTQAASQNQTVKITVSILPQEYFVKRIGGDLVNVTTLVQPGYSPATYAPTPKQMAGLATSTIYFRIGVPFENTLIPKLTRLIPQLTIVDQRQDIDMLPLKESHIEHDEHQGDLDPHTWLDPKLALKQSIIIRDTLIRFDPQGAPEYNNNFASLAQDLKNLDSHLQKALKPFAGSSIYVFHPAYGYFCRAYDLTQKAINPSGKEPGARYLARLIEQANNENVQIIFVQPQFSDKAARTIAQSIGGNVVAIDPLAKDYLANMQSIARQLVTSLIQPDKHTNEETF
jgi:zinc transport system substrate-binding protein